MAPAANVTCQPIEQTTRNSGDIGKDDLSALLYIVVTLLFYSMGIIIGIITYLKREQADIEEDVLFERYLQLKRQPFVLEKIERVQQMALYLKQLEEERNSRFKTDAWVSSTALRGLQYQPSPGRPAGSFSDVRTLSSASEVQRYYPTRSMPCISEDDCFDGADRVASPHQEANSLPQIHDPKKRVTFPDISIKVQGTGSSSSAPLVSCSSHDAHVSYEVFYAASESNTPRSEPVDRKYKLAATISNSEQPNFKNLLVKNDQIQALQQIYYPQASDYPREFSRSRDAPYSLLLNINPPSFLAIPTETVFVFPDRPSRENIDVEAAQPLVASASPSVLETHNDHCYTTTTSTPFFKSHNDHCHTATTSTTNTELASNPASIIMNVVSSERLHQQTTQESLLNTSSGRSAKPLPTLAKVQSPKDVSCKRDLQQHMPDALTIYKDPETSLVRNSDPLNIGSTAIETPFSLSQHIHTNRSQQHIPKTTSSTCDYLENMALESGHEFTNTVEHPEAAGLQPDVRLSSEHNDGQTDLPVEGASGCIELLPLAQVSSTKSDGLSYTESNVSVRTDQPSCRVS